MSLPESHPSVHEHQGKTCPVTGETHDFCPPQPGDSRSACPGLNIMANHGYIARDGKNLSAQDIIHGLQACYNLSSPLAYFLAYLSFTLLRKIGRRVSLYDISKHGPIEHNASLVHHDTPEGQVFAPIEIDPKLVDALCADVKPSAEEMEANPANGDRLLMGFEDAARARIRREKECGPISSIYAIIAQGEVATIMGIWEVKTPTKSGIPIEYLRRLITEERLPDGWKPDHNQGLWDLTKRAGVIKKAVQALRQKENDANKQK